MSLDNADAFIKDSHTLTLVNSDSQSADVVFPIDPMKIESVSDPDKSGNNDATVTVTGKNFAHPTKYKLLDAAGKPINLDSPDKEDATDNEASPSSTSPTKERTIGDATIQSPTSLTVVRRAGVTAPYKLVLISSVGLTAEKTV